MSPAALPIALRISLWIAAPLLLFGAICWVASRRPVRMPRWLDASLASDWAPVVVGGITAAIGWYVWGSLTEPGLVHDERAYLLQAQIFASGHWTGPTPPVPAFFEQMHVFLEPRLAAKYPPGHSLLLVPGMWVGLPGLMPVILNGVSGALVFGIARRVAGSAVALFTWAFWSTSPEALMWRASYFSQTTSAVLWLLSIWALLRWRVSGTRLHLGIAVASMAWMYLTRPLSALGLGLPMVVFVLMRVHQQRRWRQILVPGLAIVPVLLLSMVWQERTLGSWFSSPYAEYSRQYFPFDKPGFGADPSPPLRTMPPEISWVGQQFLAIHAAHQPQALPAILFKRVLALLVALGSRWRSFLVVLFLVGAYFYVGSFGDRSARGPARFALASSLLLVLGYLTFAHPPEWTVYYVEIYPVFFFVAAAGLFAVGESMLGLDRTKLQLACLLFLVIATPKLYLDVRSARWAHQTDSRPQFYRNAANALATIPDRAAVVFVHYSSTHDHHVSLITNTPDYRTAHLWIVYDRGAGNARLLACTDRPAYRLNTDDWTLQRLR
jgi:Dolichyl-phosphate-mannose-protein mannosyltransferase